LTNEAESVVGSGGWTTYLYRHCYAEYFLSFLLNNCSAEQPISLCLQYLHVRLARINPFPIVVKPINMIVAKSRIRLNLIIIKTIAIRSGTREINKSLNYLTPKEAYNKSLL